MLVHKALCREGRGVDIPQDLRNMVKKFAGDWLEPQPYKDFIHCVIARNRMQDPAALTSFYNNELQQLQQVVENKPLYLRISDQPYVGQVLPFLTIKE